MDTLKPYVVFRIDATGESEVVYSAHCVREARFWLAYLARPGDALFLTPKHPLYSGSGEFQYAAHALSRGRIAHQETEWRRLLERIRADGTLPFLSGWFTSGVSYSTQLTPEPGEKRPTEVAR